MTNSNSKRILLTGGAGYIGSALIPKLLSRGHFVRVLDNFLYGIEPIQGFLAHSKFEVIQADFCKKPELLESMWDIDIVIHLGGIVGDAACRINETATVETNLNGTCTLAKVAKANGVERFIFASSCSVYGFSDQVVDENSPVNPLSLYALTKVTAEQQLAEMRDADFHPVMLRFSTLYGMSNRFRFDLVVNLLTAQAIYDRRINIFGGHQWRPFIHVEDAANSIIKTMDAPLELVDNRVFNVGFNEENYTLEQIGKFIQNLAPGTKLNMIPSEEDNRSYRVNFDNISETLAFTPSFSLARGIEKTVTAIKTNDLRDYRNRKYHNAKFLEEINDRNIQLQKNGMVADRREVVLEKF